MIAAADVHVSDDPTDIAWAAGLFEGEGCIAILTQTTKNGKKSPRLRLCLTMTDEDCVVKFATILGTPDRVRGPLTHKTQPKSKPFWSWQVENTKAFKILDAIYPHLGNRRRQKADEAYALRPQIKTRIRKSTGLNRG